MSIDCGLAQRFRISRFSRREDSGLEIGADPFSRFVAFFAAPDRARETRARLATPDHDAVDASPERRVDWREVVEDHVWRLDPMNRYRSDGDRARHRIANRRRVRFRRRRRCGLEVNDYR